MNAAKAVLLFTALIMYYSDYASESKVIRKQMWILFTSAVKQWIWMFDKSHYSLVYLFICVFPVVLLFQDEAGPVFRWVGPVRAVFPSPDELNAVMTHLSERQNPGPLTCGTDQPSTLLH